MDGGFYQPAIILFPAARWPRGCGIARSRFWWLGIAKRDGERGSFISPIQVTFTVRPNPPNMKTLSLRILAVLAGIAAITVARAQNVEVGTVNDTDNGLIILDLNYSFQQDDAGNFDGSASYNLVNDDENHGYGTFIKTAINSDFVAHNVYVENCYNYEGTVRLYIIVPPGHYTLSLGSYSGSAGSPLVSANIVAVGAPNSDWENYHPGEAAPYATY
jgi:hypothetical protein